jgi:AcrR family transcriptional regulator
MVWKRARTDAQKEQRRTALLQAAAQLFEREGFDQVSLNGIARAANISKANIYRYFESREEIFLHLLLDDLRSLRAALVERLMQTAVAGNDGAVVEALLETFAEHPRLCTLLTVLTAVLERNVDVDTVVWFKASMLAEMGLMLDALEDALPGLSSEQVQRFFSMCHLLLTGIWSASHPPPAVRTALERPELSALVVDYERDLRAALHTVLRGLRA